MYRAIIEERGTHIKIVKITLYMLAFVCIIHSFAGTYKQTAFICKETNSIMFIWLMLNLSKSCKLVHLSGFSKS